MTAQPEIVFFQDREEIAAHRLEAQRQRHAGVVLGKLTVSKLSMRFQRAPISPEASSPLQHTRITRKRPAVWPSIERKARYTLPIGLCTARITTSISGPSAGSRVRPARSRHSAK